MSMITKCPSCGTAFRVTPQQLQAQHGMVRCGRCATVFDGFKTLATLRDESPVEGAAQTIAVSGSEPNVEKEPAQPPIASAPAAVAEPSAMAPLPATSMTEQPQEIATPEPPPAPAAEQFVTELPATAPLPATQISEQPQEIVTPEPPPVPAAEQFVTEPLPQRRTGGWAFGAGVLLIALAAQGAYFYRGEIGANLPEARHYLEIMCEQLRCSVALPQRPRSISIEASDMQATDPVNPGLIALTATLRSHATIELGYPALDVVLTNAKDHTVARRIFLPAQYLDAGKDPRSGIPPNAEVTVRLDLDIGDLGAAGFRLDLLAAPMR